MKEYLSRYLILIPTNKVIDTEDYYVRGEEEFDYDLLTTYINYHLISKEDQNNTLDFTQWEVIGIPRWEYEKIVVDQQTVFDFEFDEVEFDEPNIVLSTERKDFPKDDKRCTCYDCPINDTCIYAFDEYNTDDDCLLDK